MLVETKSPSEPGRSDCNPALPWDDDQNVLMAFMRRWASIAASMAAYLHARGAFRGKVFEDCELGHQDRRTRRMSWTSRIRSLEIASESVHKQLISKLCRCQCVPNSITLLLTRTEIKLPCGPSGSLFRIFTLPGSTLREDRNYRFD